MRKTIENRLMLARQSTAGLGISSVMFLLATVPTNAEIRDPAAAPVTTCFFRLPDVQVPGVEKSIKIANGVVTCTYDGGKFNPPPYTPLSAESAVGVFINLYENYPNANKYVLLVPKDGDSSESFRLVIFKSAIRAAFMGKGESGNAHYNETYIRSHISEYADGLPVSDYHYPA